MKIVFLEAVQNFGGARKSTVEFAERLNGSGHQAAIVDFWGCCDEFVNETNSRGIKLYILDKRENPFLINHPNILKRLGNYLVYANLILSYKKKFKEIIAEFSPDLIIVNNTKTLSILQKSSQYKIGYFARGWFLPHTINKLSKSIIKKKVDLFLAVSQATRYSIFSNQFVPLESIYVIQNGIDVQKIEEIKAKSTPLTSWEEETGDRAFTILHCGGFMETKGQHVTIEVAKKLKEKGKKFKIIFTGIIYKGGQSEKYYNKILNQIKQHELDGYIEIVLNKSNVLEYFAKCDVLVHPSYTEGLPRVIMEAMAMRKPVIGNPVGGMTDFILNNFTGCLTNFNAVDEYVDNITQLMDEKSLYHMIAENAYQLIKNNYKPEDQINSFDKIKF